MAAPPAPAQRTSTAITAATATLITLAILALDRRLRRHETSEVQAQSLLHALAAHHADIERGERHIRALPEPGQDHPRRTG